MSIRVKIAINLTVYALIACYLAYRELYVFHPDML